MVKGLYTAYTGMVNSQYRLDVVSNNLANATTTGFKKEGCTTKAFNEMLGVKINDLTVGHINQKVGGMSLGAKIGETYRNWDQGSMTSTENTYDLALTGAGFFSIEFTNKAGQTYTMYTRDGSFQMNKDGFIVTKDGDYLLGESGVIQIPTDTCEFTVDADGSVYADGEYIDKLAIVDFEDYNYLEMYGENLYVTVDGATQKEAVGSVMQGYLEASNINVVQEMVEMITIAREYESGQKVINTIDEMLGRMVSISEL